MRIVADENIPYLEALLHHYPVDLLRVDGRRLSADQVVNADAILCRSVTQVTADLLERSTVKYVGSATIGVDHIDTAYLREKNIGFTNAPGCNANAVAQYVLSAILHAKAIGRLRREPLTAGIVGYGNVGKRVAQYLSAIGIHCLVNDPPEHERSPISNHVSFNELLAQSDIVTLHVPLTKVEDSPYPTYHMINNDTLESIKPDAVLINTARGAVIDNQALCDVLKRNDRLYTAIDVWESEPAPMKELVSRVDLATPHIAGYSLDGKYAGTLQVVNGLIKQFGLSEKDTPNVALPPIMVDKVVLHPELGLFDALGALAKNVYDINIDSGFLKHAIEYSNISERFDQWRKNYRLRREFGALAVEAPEFGDVYSKLGFNVV
jgi:erythronate-4-phosphate dehydrogenase